eukprot:CAMPEP_0185027646 /NCGR_PEP_ID=MMETSP1103-20130426/12896_1 /TAXON_ID=36769 /ORGANISM="Paraphysomonas bandaiensis, Strain Caron Lab Isolate" /LENGTH=1135 /DNA_ID=CAMNT_0027561745 /DNA_START=154 /DNA_END=3561 /DNA_ORIENTATION=+
MDTPSTAPSIGSSVTAVLTESADDTLVHSYAASKPDSTATVTVSNASANNDKNDQADSTPKHVSIMSTVEHNRFESVVRILMETLQEQGALRALMEHTHDSPSSKPGDIESRLQGTLVELEKTVHKLITARTELEQERKRRVSFEKALDITAKQLEEANLKIVSLKDDLKDAKRVIQILRETDGEKQPLQHPSSPPHSKRSREYSDEDFRTALPPPPLPPPEDESEELEVPLQTTEHGQELVHSPESPVGSPGKRPEGAPSQGSRQDRAKTTSPSVLLDIDLGDGQKGTISVNSASNPIELAYEFVYKHGLNPDYIDPLVEYVSRTMETLRAEMDSTEHAQNSTSEKSSPRDTSHEGSMEEGNSDARSRTVTMEIDAAESHSPSPPRNMSTSYKDDEMEAGVELEASPQSPTSASMPATREVVGDDISTLRALLDSGSIRSTEQLLEHINMNLQKSKINSPARSISPTNSERQGSSPPPVPDVQQQPLAQSQRSTPSEDDSTIFYALSDDEEQTPKSRGCKDASVQSDITSPFIEMTPSGRAKFSVSSDGLYDMSHDSLLDNDVSLHEDDLCDELNDTLMTSVSQGSSRSYASPSPSEDSNDTQPTSNGTSSPSKMRSSQDANTRFDDGTTVDRRGRQRSEKILSQSSSPSRSSVGLQRRMNFAQTAPAPKRRIDESPSRYYSPDVDLTAEVEVIYSPTKPSDGYSSTSSANEDNAYIGVDDNSCSETGSDIVMAPVRDDTNMENVDRKQRMSDSDSWDEGSNNSNNSDTDTPSGAVGSGFDPASILQRLRTGSASPQKTYPLPLQSKLSAVERLKLTEYTQDMANTSPVSSKADPLNSLEVHNVSPTSRRNYVGRNSPKSESLEPHPMKIRFSPAKFNPEESVALGETLSSLADELDPLEVAIEVFDSATTLANEGNLDDAIPLYLHALKIFEEYQYDELPMIREEIWKWVSLADSVASEDGNDALIQLEQRDSHKTSRHGGEERRSRSTRKSDEVSGSEKMKRSSRSKSKSSSPKSRKDSSKHSEISRTPSRKGDRASSESEKSSKIKRSGSRTEDDNQSTRGRSKSPITEKHKAKSVKRKKEVSSGASIRTSHSDESDVEIKDKRKSGTPKKSSSSHRSEKKLRDAYSFDML